MKSWPALILCLCASSMIAGEAPEIRPALKEGTIVYALEKVWWTLSPAETDHFPFDQIECKGLNCRYTLPPCEPLYVLSQYADITEVVPKDRERQAILNNALQTMRPANVRGGTSTKYKKHWTLSRDQCLAAIKAPGKDAPPAKQPDHAPAEKASPR